MFTQTTALHENLQPLHSFEWTGVRAQWGGWHTEFGHKKKKKALLGSTCEKAESADQVLPNDVSPMTLITLVTWL